jgi:hypothetical protein
MLAAAVETDRTVNMHNAHNPLRGIHAPLTQGRRRVREDEIEAIARMSVGSVSIFEDHLKDERFTTFLHHEAALTGLEVYCRLMPAGSPPNPVSTAEAVIDLAGTYPWVRGWLPVSEPNQWPNMQWRDISDWLIEFYDRVVTGRNHLDIPFMLYFPPLAQDLGGEMDHKAGWDSLEPIVQMFLDNGDGFSWYSYWYALDLKGLTESDMPRWLAAALEDGPTRYKTLIVEAGRFDDEPLGVTYSLGDEIAERFGSEARRMRSRSLAHAVTYWVLGSVDPAFERQAWIGEDGTQKPIVDYIVHFGP